jgi:hypothetical protein
MAIATDSRHAAACCHVAVITLSTAVMQFDPFFHQIAIRSAIRASRVMLNDAPTRTLFINLKPRR